MSINPYDKPIATLREETIDQLIVNYSHGKLSLEAFERRLDQALDAETHEILLLLTDDLDLVADNTYKEKKKREFGYQAYSQDATDVDYMVNIFGGTNRKGPWIVPRDFWIVNIFAGSELDFSEARFSSQTTHINVFSLFGGIDFYLPEGIKTVSKAICIFGGFDDRIPDSNVIDAPTLIIEGITLFSGIDIKLKKTFRRQVLKFANSVKSMFTTSR